MNLLRRLRDGESGQDLIEYALLAALIATVTFAALQGAGLAIAAFYQRMTTRLATL